MQIDAGLVSRSCWGRRCCRPCSRPWMSDAQARLFFVEQPVAARSSAVPRRNTSFARPPHRSGTFYRPSRRTVAFGIFGGIPWPRDAFAAAAAGVLGAYTPTLLQGAAHADLLNDVPRAHLGAQCCNFASLRSTGVDIAARLVVASQAFCFERRTLVLSVHEFCFIR